MRAVIYLFIFFTSSIVFAQWGYRTVDNDPGYLVCDTIMSNSRKTECVGVVSAAHYIDASAAQVCRSISSDSRKVDCVRNIADKQFVPAASAVCSTVAIDSRKADCMATMADRDIDDRAAAVCRGQTSDSRKLECMRQASRPLSRRDRCPSYDDILERVQTARRQLRDRDGYAAERTLYMLEDRIQVCR